MQLCANISLMFNEIPLEARFSAAKAAGFDCVEIQFPDEADMPRLIAARSAADIPVTLINVPRGGGNVGLGAVPGRGADFAAAIAATVKNAHLLGARKVNVLAGRPPPEADPETCWQVLIANLRHAADSLGADGVRVMVEPINPVDVPGFFLDGLDKALEALERADHPNLFLQFDLYHMAITEPDLTAAIIRAGTQIGHVQFADSPGRHAPGTGRIDFAAAIENLKNIGYDDVIAAEYIPLGDTHMGLGWMSEFRKLTA